MTKHIIIMTAMDTNRHSAVIQNIWIFGMKKTTKITST